MKQKKSEQKEGLHKQFNISSHL